MAVWMVASVTNGMVNVEQSCGSEAEAVAWADESSFGEGVLVVVFERGSVLDPRPPAYSAARVAAAIARWNGGKEWE